MVRNPLRRVHIHLRRDKKQPQTQQFQIGRHFQVSEAVASLSFNLFNGLSIGSSSSSAFLRGEFGSIQGVGQKFFVCLPIRSPLMIGVKIYGDQVAKPGSFTKFHPGKNVGIGKDHTAFSLIDGLVKFEKFGPDKKKISVYPCVVQPKNPLSYRARKRGSFRLQRVCRRARKEGVVVEPQLVLASAAESLEDSPAC